MSQEDHKRRAAEAALEAVREDTILGIGTGSTVNHFIDLLAEHDIRLRGTVSSSEATTTRLRRHGYEVLELNETGNLPMYIDGADEFNRHGQLIKGGGGALTREKIIAAASDTFLCIVDESKSVRMLGRFPLPVEVIPMARSFVGRRIERLGGRPVLREGVTTDNGNLIIDVHDLEIFEPIKLERSLNDIPGIVCNGLFAMRGADTLLVAGADGVERIDVPRTR